MYHSVNTTTCYHTIIADGTSEHVEVEVEIMTAMEDNTDLRLVIYNISLKHHYICI